MGHRRPVAAVCAVASYPTSLCALAGEGGQCFTHRNNLFIAFIGRLLRLTTQLKVCFYKLIHMEVCNTIILDAAVCFVC